MASRDLQSDVDELYQRVHRLHTHIGELHDQHARVLDECLRRISLLAAFHGGVEACFPLSPEDQVAFDRESELWKKRQIP